jgi:predicted transcriptional regulator
MAQNERLFRLATHVAYVRFCRTHAAYRSCLANQLWIMNWIDERRIEMRAKGRPHWVPSMEDFEQAVRDCGDDLVKSSHSRYCSARTGSFG